MGVYKYTKALANAAGLKTKPKPWLHCAIEVYQEGVSVAVFVWDTREVVEQDYYPFKDYREYRMFANDFYRRKYAKALDNGQKLKWKGKPLQAIDNALCK
jgi:hypothetical protein